MMRTRNEKYYTRILQMFEFGLPLWSHLRAPFLLQRVLLATCFSEPLRGTPWADFGLPGGTLDPIRLTCLT